MKLGNLSHTQVCEATEAEHGYEVLDKYNQAYAEVKLYDPPNTKAEDMACPAYISPITTLKTSSSAQELNKGSGHINKGEMWKNQPNSGTPK